MRAICKKSDTMPVKWIHTYVIESQNFLYMKSPADSSWTVRKLWKLRDLGRSLVKHVVGNGENTWVWLDNWHLMGPLYKTIGEEVVYHMGRSLNTKVSSIVVNNGWRWPRPRNEVTQQIMANTPGSFLPKPGKEDKLIWLPSPNGSFSIQST